MPTVEVIVSRFIAALPFEGHRQFYHGLRGEDRGRGAISRVGALSFASTAVPHEPPGLSRWFGPGNGGLVTHGYFDSRGSGATSR